jgi:hypothetical protein
MAKLKNIRVGYAEFNEFLATSSDFAFELRCLERLSQPGPDKIGNGLTSMEKQKHNFTVSAEHSDVIHGRRRGYQ